MKFFLINSHVTRKYPNENDILFTLMKLITLRWRQNKIYRSLHCFMHKVFYYYFLLLLEVFYRIIYTFLRLTYQQRRQLEGCLCRVPKHFYRQVWDVLTKTPEGIKFMGKTLHQQPTLSDMTKSELSFSLLVEEVTELSIT